ncbi:MAG: TraR/DksA C4-type zinc finger protein [Candidatus Pacebacteria bacterium]|nr:TraR/DksA C4-type zinc finger protein [Candidatus Paceibacterota bacterium]
MTIDIQKLKTKLEEEKKQLETSLSEVGQKNPTNPKDWEGKAENIDAETSDPNDVADNIEEYETNTAITSELEVRLNNINTALERIESGTYGTCRVCGKKIEEDRLEANPAAQTCKEHIND